MQGASKHNLTTTMSIDVTKLSLTELKAYAFDLRNSIELVMEEIIKRQSIPSVEKKEEEAK